MSDTLMFFIIDSLEDSIRYLKAYCHRSFCKRIDKCPKEHFWCKLKLDLGTAIAWEVANKLTYEISYIESLLLARNYKEAMVVLEKLIHIIDSYLSVLLYHTHKYYKLCTILSKAKSDLKQLHYVINEEMK